MDYFKHKYYLTHNNIRVAHVHIIGDEYIVCGHYKRFTDFKRRVFDKSEFETFMQHSSLEFEKELVSWT